MNKQGVISIRQFTILVLYFVVGSSILFTPSVLAAESKQDAWLAGLVALGAGLLVVWVYNALAKRFQDRTFLEFCEHTLGKWPGRILCLLLVLHFFLLSSLVLRDMGDFISSEFLPNTPIEAVLLIYLPVVLYGVRLGIESIAQTAELLFPLFLVLFVILLVLISPHGEFDNMLPILENGMKPIARSAWVFWGFPFLELVCFLMYVPTVQNKKKLPQAFTLGTLGGGLCLTLITFLCVLVLGPTLTVRSSFSSYTLAKKINIGDFLTRIEEIMTLIWLLSLYFKLVLNFYATASGLSQLLKIKDERVLLVPLALLAYFVCVIEIPNSTYFYAFTTKTYTFYVLPYGLLFPLLLLLVSHVRHKQGTHSTKV